jgi:hypothetical protein
VLVGIEAVNVMTAYQPVVQAYGSPHAITLTAFADMPSGSSVFSVYVFDLHSKAPSISKQKFFSLHLEKASDVFMQLAQFVFQSLVL